MPYSNIELSDMVFMYGRANGSGPEARRLYAEAYPDRQLPSHVTFHQVFRRLRETGSFKKNARDTGRPRSVSTAEVEEQILNIVTENPGTSVRKISAEVGISGPLVWRTMHQQLLYPFHVQRVQALNPPDHQARRTFCQWVLTKIAEQPHFTSNILFTDEAGFTRDGIFNFHNSHIWADENPHAIHESRHQQRFSINIWLGILGDLLLGPVVLPRNLTGAAYLNFLQNTLADFLDVVPLNQLMNIWFMQDGAPPHYTLAVREHLDQTFPERWIGRRGPVPWPARSPDLNPLDFCIWGYLKNLVYATSVNNIEELQHRIELSCQTIRIQPGLFERVRNSFMRRCTSCIEMDGGHMEHLL